jgi:GNAT superfamily N-acetyltransferase
MTQIIKAKQEHFETLFSLIESMVEESVFSYAKPSKAKIQKLFNYPRGAAFLAYRDGVCIGFIGAVIDSFFFSDYERATDVGFYILPEYRGGREAFRLLQAVEQWAKEQGVSEIFMGHSVGGKIEEMKKFYIHQGYKIGGFNSMKKL